MKIAMSAISVHQPWAWLIVHGYKDLENRRNPPPKTKVNKRVAIHSPMRKVTKAEWEEFLEIARELRIKEYPKTVSDFVYGAVIGTVLLEGAKQSPKSYWAGRGKSHWKLSQPRTIRPVKSRGYQSWFTVRI